MSFNSGKVKVTIEELISTVKHSSLPTVFIEGSDDAILFRRLEDIHAANFLSVLAVGGRDVVLKLFERRSEIPNGNIVLFIADRDTYVMSGIPEKYQSSDLLFTDGYSIENDVIRSVDLKSFMDAKEKAEFELELNLFVDWYAPVLDKFMADHPEKLRCHPNQVLGEKKNSKTLGKSIIQFPPDSSAAAIYENYERLLRGKSLMALMMRHLSYANRAVNIQSSNIMEMAGANPTQFVAEIFERVAERLNAA